MLLHQILLILILTLACVSVGFFFIYIKNRKWFKDNFKKLFIIGTTVVISTAGAAIFYTPLGNDTGWYSPSSTGNIFNEWSNPDQAFSSDDAYASTDTDAMKQDYSGFVIIIPSGATIDGIAVEIEGYVDSGTASIIVELSDDAGYSWTTTGYSNEWDSGSGEYSQLYGGETDDWGVSWIDETAADLWVLIELSGIDKNVISVDHIQVKVYYTESAGNNAPVITANSQNPKNESTKVSLSLDGNYSHFNISVTDIDDATQNMNITWKTNETTGIWHTIGTNTSVNNGTYYCDNISWINKYNHKYWWKVSVNDGIGGWDNETYSFTTLKPPSILIYDNFTMPENSFGCGNITTPDFNWAFLESTIIYNLKLDEVDISDNITVSYEMVNGSRDYIYDLCFDDTGDYIFNMTFNSGANSVVINTSTHIVTFCYDEGNLTCDYGSASEDANTSDDFDIVGNMFRLKLNGTAETPFSCVHIDPIFGFTGTISQTRLHFSTNCYMVGSKYQALLGGGVAQSISVQFGSLGSSEYYHCALYSDAGAGWAGTLLGQTYNVSVTSTMDNQWVTFNFSGTKPVITNNAYYYVVVTPTNETIASAANNIKIFLGSGTANNFNKYSATPIPFDSTLTGEQGSNAIITSYCTYIPDILTSVNTITPYQQTSSPIVLNATSVGVTPTSADLFYRWSADNVSWGGFTSNYTDAVDSNTANVDGLVDTGTETNFANCQDTAPDTDVMTIVEADMGYSYVSESKLTTGWTATDQTWVEHGTSPYLGSDEGTSPVNYIQTTANNQVESWFTLQDTTAVGNYFYCVLYVDFDGTDADDDCKVDLDWNNDGSPDFTITWTNPGSSTRNAFITGMTTTTQINNARLKFTSITSGTAGLIVDCAYITILRQAFVNQMLDFEYGWTSATYNRDVETLCIYTSTHTGGTEGLDVYYWLGTKWSNNLGTISSIGWTNFTLTGLTGSTYTIKLVGHEDASDITQDTWTIDCIFLKSFNNVNNPAVGHNWMYNSTDAASPWSWNFPFGNGTAYYEFYSIGKASGSYDEFPPYYADAKCYYVSAGTPPTITINFAGNLSDTGGPYYVPPAESTTTAADGYYTNNSRQSESWIYINCTVTDATDVVLQWINTTSITGNYAFTHRGNYWDINTSTAGIVTRKGYNYSFNINATGTGGNKIAWWNKTGIGGGLTRRFVQLNYSTDTENISYRPLYLYNHTSYSGIYVAGDASKYDRLYQDQGPDGTTTDTGFLMGNVPTDTLMDRHCSTYLWFWYNNRSCVKPFTLSNIYYHFWWNTSTIRNYIKYVGYDQSRFAVHMYNGDSFNATASDSKSNITRGSKQFHLTSCLLDKDNYVFSDNDIYELVIYMLAESPNGYPNVICNRSFTSFILLNVPSNATLNSTGDGDSDDDGLNDWTELYATYTNPFLSDTDNDGDSDYEEIIGITDPNDWTDHSINTPPTIFGEIPVNQSIGVNIYPVCNVTVNDADGDAMTVTFAAYKSGSWVNYQTNTSVGNGSVSWGYAGAKLYNTTYQWRVYCNDGTVNISEIYNFTTKPNIPPVATIVYAGNTTYSGKPYYIPPLNITSLENSKDGYFVNGSHIPENSITIKANVTSDNDIASVKVHLLNMTTNIWNNDTSMNFISGNLYGVNATGFSSGHKYSFDVNAIDEYGNSINTTWYKNKTCNPAVLLRRCVFLNCVPDNDAFEYTPFYAMNVTKQEVPKTGEVSGVNAATSKESRDIWYQDQHITSNTDSGYLALDEPDANTSYTYCGGAIWLPISLKHGSSNNISINSTQIENVYIRSWWSNNTFDGNTSFNDMGILIKDDDAPGSPGNADYKTRFYSANARAILNISDWVSTQDWIPSYRTHILLGTGKISFTNASYVFDSNYIYQLVYTQTGSGTAIFCNESYLSYILFNIPDNATLVGMDSDSDTLNDYNELFLNYTSPFHTDTDGDGQSDSWEIEHSYDPNLYTDFSNPPEIYGENPVNNSIDISFNPLCNVTVFDANSDNMDVTFASNYSNGVDWVNYQTNSSMPSGSNVIWTFTGANTNNKIYWWRVYANDGTTNISEIYHFATAYIQNRTIRTNGIDYFTWLGANTTASVVKLNMTGFNEVTEYLSIFYNNGTWMRYYGDGTGTNWNIHTFDIVQSYMDDAAGNITFNMTANPFMIYTNHRTITLKKIGNGYNYTGYTNTTNTTLLEINTTLSLASGYFCGLWNRTTFTWNIWISGFGITNKAVSRWNVIMTKIEANKTWIL